VDLTVSNIYSVKKAAFILEQQLTELQNSIIESAKIQNGGETGFLKSKMESLRRGYRLAFGDGRYREYQNEYSTNELAKPFKQRSKERDKKKYLSARFALTDEGEFTVCFRLIFITFVI
jgi:hypothetical protein